MGLKDSLGKLDRALDRRLERLPDISSQTDREKYRAAVKDGVSRATRKAGATIKSLDEMGDRAAGKLRPKRGIWDRWIEYSVHHPITVLLSILLVTALIATQAIYIQKEMRGDMEIYLPADEESTKILNEVRQSWATDIIIVYVQANDWNKDGKPDNLTDLESLVEMSHIEGDDTNKDAANELDKGVDPDKGDRGKDDRIVYCLSISTLIKEVNSTPGRIAHQFGLPETSGAYAIPPDQSTIDTIVGAIPADTISSLLKDTNKDGIYDRAAIIIGVKSGTPPAQIVSKVDRLLKHQGPTHCVMSNTGPMTVIEKIQGRTILEFIKVMPFVVVYLMMTMFVFHRTFKAPVVGIIPVALALIITYGIVGALHSYLIISPQIALVAPMLLALGISYCHFIINRYTEEKLGTPFERAARAAKIMTPAIVLSAVATAIGFFSLMVGTLAPVAVMGFALGIGILLTCVLMLTLVPTLMVFTKYKKGVHWGGWRRIGAIPSDHRKKTLLVVLVFLTVSILLLPSVKFNADYLAMAPNDDPSFTNMNEYSRTMGGGQMGMVIVRGDAKEIGVLKGMDGLEEEMNKAPFTKCMSVVDIMKMIKFPENITYNGQTYDTNLNVSFWTMITESPISPFPGAENFMINMFYGSLSPEMLSFLVNDDFSKTLIYIFQPMMDIENTRKAVDGVNNAIDMKPIGGATVSHITGMGAIQLAVNDLLIEGQLISLVVCTFATWLVLLAIFRSWKLALFTMIPCMVVVGLEPLVLVGLNIPLSIVTVMIGSIGIGTGVDFSIQLSQRIRTGGLNIDSVKNSVENLGISFVEATTVTVFAFMAVLLSPSALVTYSLGTTPTNWFTMGVPIDSVRQFVIMIQVLFCLNAIAAMFILPAIYTVWLRFRESEKRRREKEGW